MVQPNYRFRALTDNPAEARAVTDAFARSILWGFTPEAETNGRVLVDMTAFLIRDAVNSAQRMSPGTYRLDESRSSIYMDMTKAFPENTEMEVELIQPIAMDEGLRFAIREGGRTVGAGRVTKITK